MSAARRAAGWPAFWMGVACVVTKALHWSLPALEASRVATWFLDIGVSAHQDVLFACVTGSIGALLLRGLSGMPRAQTAFWWIYLLFCASAVVFAVASIQIFAFLRSPLTYALLYLADDFGNMRSSLGAFISPAVAAGLCLTPVVWALLTWRSLLRPPLAPRLRAACGLALVGWVIAGSVAYAGRWNDRDDHLIAKSPHAALVFSYAREWLGLGAAEQFSESYPKEFLADFEPPAKLAVSRFAGQPRPKNVILVVLESTAAKYLGVFGSKYDSTPNLVRESKHALLFDAFYCHAGLTANSNAALTLSIYPYMTWREYTVEYPDMPGESLANVLKQHDYRTAFIHSGDLAYVNQRAFMTGRGYDTMWDWHDLGAPLLTSWATHDRALVDGVLKWLDQDEGKRKPFFAKVWTHMSHHPYEPMPDEPLIDFFKDGKAPIDDYDLGRYLNTVHFVDEQLGRLFEGLRERGLADDTLVVITGDHGEAFGDPHGAWGHGSRVYDECSRVPLLVWSPRLFAESGRLTTVGGHVDVNPTIADVLGIPASPTWRGRSLFDANRTGRAYFYAANDDYLLGVREGKWKYIYNATRGGDELFDMTADPEESTNVAKAHKDLCKTRRQRRAAWRDDTGRHLAAIRAARVAKPGS